MALVVVERAFDEPCDPDALQALEDAVAWCLQTHRVRFLRTYVANDRTRMVCFYEAPDVESVRATQRTAGLPVAHVWSADPVPGDEADPPAGYTLVVVQRQLPPAITMADIERVASDPAGCGKRLRVQRSSSLVSRDRTRMTCAFHSPDLESVRVLNRESGLPAEAIWRGTEFLAKS